MQQRSYNLLRELSRAHDVIFLAFNQKAHLSDDGLFEAQAELSKFCHIQKVLPIPCDQHRFGKVVLAIRSLLTMLPYTINWLKSDDFRREVEGAVRQHKPDLVHFDTISLAPYITCVQGVPTSLNHHNIESDMLLRRARNERSIAMKLYYWQEGKRLRQSERAWGGRSDVHLVCSAIDAQRLRRIVPGAAIRVIPNGVDLEYFSPSRVDSVPVEKSLIFAGRLNWYPNILAIRFLLDEVWPMLTSADPAISLVLVGKSPPRDLEMHFSASKRVKFTGFVPDVRPYLKSATVYVCPVFDGGGTKLKILDAMAMGCAIVAHPIACEGIEVQDGVHVLFASTAKEFVEKVMSLLGQSALRQQLGGAARRLVELKYSFTGIGKELSDCYQALGERSRSW